MTVKEYYKHFKSIYGAIAAAIGSVPLVAFLPIDFTHYLFPPLGSWEVFSKIATLILLVMVTLLVYFVSDAPAMNSKKRRHGILFSCAAIAFVGILAYLASSLRFIRTISVPSEHRMITVSVGYDRTAFARGDELVTKDDWDLLAARGTTEQEILRLWTFRSILMARLALFGSYLLFLLFVFSIGSLAVLYDKLGPAASP